jgi:GntR family transcriptional regulator/MocR family aminotransferase
VTAVVNARAVADRNSPVIDQAALAEFITAGHYERHLRRLRLICQERYHSMRHHFARVLGDQVVLSPSSAGTHVLGYFNDSVAADIDLARRVSSMAGDEGLVVFPLSRYCLTPPPRDALVLGFGGLSPRRIATGAEKLAAILKCARKVGRR